MTDCYNYTKKIKLSDTPLLRVLKVIRLFRALGGGLFLSQHDAQKERGVTRKSHLFSYDAG